MLLNKLKSLLMNSERLAFLLAVMEKQDILNNSYSNIVLSSFIKHMYIHMKNSSQTSSISDERTIRM